MDPISPPISVQQISSSPVLVSRAVSFCIPDRHVAFSHVPLNTHNMYIHPDAHMHMHADIYTLALKSHLKCKVDLSPPCQNPSMSVLFSNVQSHCSVLKTCGQHPSIILLVFSHDLLAMLLLLPWSQVELVQTFGLCPCFLSITDSYLSHSFQVISPPQRNFP